MTVITRHQDLLTDDMLARFDERAPIYDRENRFFTEDFDELVASGYLLAAVPEALGGSGLALDQVLRMQRRLAYHAPATAIAINMHLYWTGLAADMVRFGDTRCAWILDEAAAGHVFAAGHGEAGNDVGLVGSTTQAERVDGGWVFTGRKVFGSLSPVWTYLGLHGMDVSDPAAPKVVHAFMPRDAEGYRIEETWDALGMRATASHDTVLDRAFVPDHLAPVVVPAGAAGADLFHLSLMAWGLLGFASVYAGVAQRAYDLVVDSAKTRGAIGLGPGRTMANNPEVQRMVAEYDRRRRMFVAGLNAIGLPTFEPKGAFYAFPSIRPTGLTSDEVSERLLFEEKVAVVPGSAFGPSGEGHVRMTLATGYDQLQEALERIGRFVAANRATA